MSPLQNLKHSLLCALAIGVPALTPATSLADEGGAHAIIVTQGTGEVEIRPDSVRVDVAAEAQAATLDQARNKVNAAMQAVIAALRALDVPDITISTRQFSFSPVYSTPKDGAAPSILGYRALNRVQVSAERAPSDLLGPRAALIVDTAMNAGANDVGNIDFYLADPADAEDRALVLAVQSARHDADTIAHAAGMAVVSLVHLEEASASRVPRALSMMAPAVASTPIEIGQITIQSNVTAKYLIR